MTSSISNSKSPDLTLSQALFPVALAVLLASGVILAVEAGYRRAGGLPKVEAGMTPVEFAYKFRHVDIGKKVIVIGDSRIGWGFSETDCEMGMHAAGVEGYEVLNGGRAGCSSGDTLLWLLEKSTQSCPGVLVVNFSPAGFYQFGPRPLPTSTPVRQVVYDDLIDQYLCQRLATHGKTGKAVFVGLSRAVRGGRLPPDVSFVRREVFKGGFYNATIETNDGQPFDPAGFQLDYYTQILAAMSKETLAVFQKRDDWISLLCEAKAKGWKVMMVRLPIGHRMACVEEKMPEALTGKSIATAAGVPFIDYQRESRLGEITTLDESHLSPDSTRRMSQVLGVDIAGLLQQSD
jgi:hypothetical protein